MRLRVRERERESGRSSHSFYGNTSISSITKLGRQSMPASTINKSEMEFNCPFHPTLPFTSLPFSPSIFLSFLFQFLISFLPSFILVLVETERKSPKRRPERRILRRPTSLSIKPRITLCLTHDHSFSSYRFLPQSRPSLPPKLFLPVSFLFFSSSPTLHFENKK